MKIEAELGTRRQDRENAFDGVRRGAQPKSKPGERLGVSVAKENQEQTEEIEIWPAAERNHVSLRQENAKQNQQPKPNLRQ
jgi:hypothetical protein